MTAIDPISGNATATAIAAATTTPAMTSTAAPSDQFGKDTFLKLLVAQLKYQNPLSPVDGTQFIAQTAQFTMVEKLNEIENQVKANAAANEVLEAGSMIGKNVSVATQSGLPAVTTVAHLGGNLPADAPTGTQVSTTATLYTTKGTAIPIKIEYTKLADGTDGSKHWEARAFLSTTQLAGPLAVDFDNHGERSSPDAVLTSDQLDAVPGTTGTWDPNGIRLDMGTAGVANRLRVGTGQSSLTLFGQNGTDGRSLAGVVTGVRFTINGPLLSIGGNEYALTDVTEVHVSG